VLNFLATSQQQNDLIEESLMLSMQRYSEIQSNLRDSLQQLDDRLDKFEDKVEGIKKKANKNYNIQFIYMQLLIYSFLEINHDLC